MTREEAIEELKILREDYWDDDGYGHETEQYCDTMSALDMGIEALENQKTGHWIRWYEEVEHKTCTENIPHCKCSECNKEYDTYTSLFIKYCSQCGAKMEGEQE